MPRPRPRPRRSGPPWCGASSPRSTTPRSTAVALLFAGALRRAEIVGLDYAAAGDGDGTLRLTPEAVEIVVLRSKARTEPATVLVPRENNPGLVAALERWIAVAGIQDELPNGRLIVRVSKHITSVIDGVIHDTHDCSREGTRCV